MKNIGGRGCYGSTGLHPSSLKPPSPHGVPSILPAPKSPNLLAAFRESPITSRKTRFSALRELFAALLPSTFLRYTQAMGILRRLKRWMGKQDRMTHIISGNAAPGFSLD